MTTYTKTILSISLCLLTYITASAQKEWTLQECIDYALEHNIDIKKQMSLIDRQKVQTEIALNKWLPRVDAEIKENLYPHSPLTNGRDVESGTTTNSSMLSFLPSVVATMPLYTGGYNKSQAAAEQFSLEEATYNLEKAKKDIRIQIATLYLQVLYSLGLEEVSKKQVEVSRQLTDRAAKLVKEGRRPEKELAEARAQLASDEYILSSQQSDVIISTMDLAHILDIEDIESFKVYDSSLSAEIAPSLSGLPYPRNTYEKIVESYPSILAKKSAIDAAEERVKMSQSTWMPQISLVGSLTASHSLFFDSSVRDLYKSIGGQLWDTFNPMIGISFKYNIFNAHETKNNVRRALFAINTARFDLDNARLALREEIQKAYYNATTSVAKYEAAIKAEEAAKISFNYEKVSYNEGRSTFFDVIQANQKWVKAQQNTVQGKYSYLIRKQILLFYTENL